jgi:hypothetical protein
MPGFNAADLIGREYLDIEMENGQQHKFRAVKAIADHFDTLAKHPERTKFLVTSKTVNYDKILSYNDIVDYLNKNTIDDNYLDDNPQSYQFKEITAHQGPLSPKDKHYKGSKCNVLIE